MQYLLSHEELAAFHKRDAELAKLPSIEKLTEACKLIATTMIATHPVSEYMRGRPYGCIHVNRRESYGYCDHCPAQEICPMPKDYSK